MKISNKQIILDKVINELDRFVIDFTNILKKHTNYVIVSGYVSILFGRTRTTEDIDLLVPKMNLVDFKKLYQDILSNNFWCINAENPEVIYNDYLNKDIAVRFARKDAAVPNMEFKLIRTIVDKTSLKESIEVKIGKNILKISPLEMQIAFKKKILGAPKDMEDARHLEKLFKDSLNMKKLKKYEQMLR
ncbi:hypothetical protein GOV06_02435 [Candidatus Woesearchaeota archaeon]|nr:hypothetical protein [Candidatus Woesearchaeota archaeon]